MKKGMVLSGLITTTILLSIFCSQAIAFTDVYTVKPTTASNSGTANAVWQTFVATCDSIDSVTYFVGAEATDTTANYLVSITDSATSQEVWSSSRSARGWKYQDMGFGVHKPVVRGRIYYLRISISAQYQQTWNYFYDNYNPYPWGRMGTATYGLNDKDLAARIVGSLRVPSDYWGMNIQMAPYILGYDTPEEKATACQTSQQAGVKWDREFFEWDAIEDKNDSFNHWAHFDSVYNAANNQGIQLIGCLHRIPVWATTRNTPPKYDTLCVPKRLFRGVNDTANWWADFVHQTATHFQGKVKVWEVYNEPNLRQGFSFPYPAPDSEYYNMFGTVHTRSDSLDSLAKLYLRMCVIADSVVKAVDPTNKVLIGSTSGVARLWWPQDTIAYYDTGYVWLKRLYRLGAQNWGDGISIHPYQFEFEASKDSTRFIEWRFHQDLDSVRALMDWKGDWGKTLWLTEIGWSSYDSSYVRQAKKADNLLKSYVSGIGDPAALRRKVATLSWWFFREYPWSTNQAEIRFGTVDSVFNPRPAYYAYKQMTPKLNNQYFNRRVPLADTNVYAYEFETPGSGKRTWVIWRGDGQVHEDSIPIRTAEFDTIMIAYDPSPPSGRKPATGTGRAYFQALDSVPRYVEEVGDTSRPDVVVDDLYTSPPNPKAGDGLKFFARIRNIGNAVLSGTVPDTVTFQVDGTTIVRYGASRGLGIPGSGTDTLTVGYFFPGYDWTATWGDHLIRAWVDSSDKYVELREDNNQGYLFKHFQPKVSVVINNDHKYTNHLTNDTLHVVMNENTSPLPDSAKLLHEWSWTKIGVYGSRDTIVAYSGNGVKYDSVKVFQGGDTYTGGDSIIVDASAPYADITSPTMNQIVSGLVPFWGWSWDYEDHDSLWEIYVNGSPWVSGNSKVGENPLFGMPGQFGTWNSRSVSNGWWWHQLRSTDAATNLAKDSVKVKVRNFQTDGGASWATDFGTYTSPVMNVATDINGNVYLAETQNSKVRKYSPRKDSLFAFSAKRGNDSTGTSWATAMILKDSTTIWIADGYAHAIKKFDRQGNLLLRFGSFGSDTSQFKQPCGIALDNKGRLFVVDRLNHRVQVFSDSTGRFLFQFGSQGTDSGRFNSPTGITIVPNGRVFVSDTRNNQLQVFDSLGHYLKTIKQVDSLGLDTPLGICSDKWGDVFIADAHHNRIVELNPYGQRILDFGGQGDSLWQFRTPVGVASSPGAHYLYVADMGNRRVQRFWVVEEDTLGGGGPQSGEVVPRIPLVYSLAQSHPNPTTGEALIEYSLPKESLVSLTVYNVAGQVVRDYKPGKQEAGFYAYMWDGRSALGHKVGAGVYFYRLQAGSWAKTRKMVVIR